MTEYRILRSPTGKRFRIQCYKETPKSCVIRLFLPSYPAEYRWTFLNPLEYCVETLAQQVIDELMGAEKDCDFEMWTVVDKKKIENTDNQA